MHPLRINRLVVCILVLGLVGCSGNKHETEHVVMQTSAGLITIELYPDKAPVTVANFKRYVTEGVYNGAYFYRATRPNNDPDISVLQGGLWRPWEPGMIKNYTPPFPPIAHETTKFSGLFHTDGVISMGRLDPGTANSEFFISIGSNPSLDFGGDRNPDGQGFAAFGRIIKGMDVVRAIHDLPTSTGNGFMGQILAEPIAIAAVRYQVE